MTFGHHIPAWIVTRDSHPVAELLPAHHAGPAELIERRKHLPRGTSANW
ncbi:MAG: hypothetical protein P4L48_07505 [Mycobacterium sp.]|nr:hypothetical protein [Mycobacterium sp.]